MTMIPDKLSLNGVSASTEKGMKGSCNDTFRASAAVAFNFITGEL